MKKRKRTTEEREESRALRERVLANAERTRKLAEKAQAELDRKQGRQTQGSSGGRSAVAKAKRTSEDRKAFHERVLANAERTRKLAEKAQADLDRRKQQQEPA